MSRSFPPAAAARGPGDPGTGWRKSAPFSRRNETISIRPLFAASCSVLDGLKEDGARVEQVVSSHSARDIPQAERCSLRRCLGLSHTREAPSAPPSSDSTRSLVEVWHRGGGAGRRGRAGTGRGPGGGGGGRG